MADEGRAEGDADRGDLILGLERLDPEVLVPGQLVEDVAGRGDGVRGVEERQSGGLGAGDQAPGDRLVADHVRVGAGRQIGGGHLEGRVRRTPRS